MLMFMIHGELPWKQKYGPSLEFKKVRKFKLYYKPELLWPDMPSKHFDDHILPIEYFKKISDHIWGLEFDQHPDYDTLEKCLLT